MCYIRATKENKTDRPKAGKETNMKYEIVYTIVHSDIKISAYTLKK